MIAGKAIAVLGAAACAVALCAGILGTFIGPLRDLSNFIGAFWHYLFFGGLIILIVGFLIKKAYFEPALRAYTNATTLAYPESYQLAEQHVKQARSGRDVKIEITKSKLAPIQKNAIQRIKNIEHLLSPEDIAESLDKAYLDSLSLVERNSVLALRSQLRTEQAAHDTRTAAQQAAHSARITASNSAVAANASVAAAQASQRAANAAENTSYHAANIDHNVDKYVNGR